MIQQDLFEAFRSPLRSALESALVENPDDLGTHMAYADHLVDLGDPRGEFVQLQLALEDPSGISPDRRAEMASRELELLRNHEAAWLGSLAPFWLDPSQPYRRNGVTWWRGWVRCLTGDDLDADIAKALVRADAGLRLLRELRIIGCEAEAEPFEILAAAPWLGRLHVLQIGEPDSSSLHQYLSDEDGDQEVSDQITPLVARATRLEELRLFVTNVDTDALFALTMPHLRRLTVHHLARYPLHVLAGNQSLTGITHLALCPRALYSGDSRSYLPGADIFALLRAPAFQGLTHLQLRLTDVGNDLLRELVAGGWFARLKVLDLYGGRIDDAGAELLLGCRDARRLESLELSYNYLSPTALKELKYAGVPVQSSAQCGEGRSDNPYEHLVQGDWE